MKYTRTMVLVVIVLSMCLSGCDKDGQIWSVHGRTRPCLKWFNSRKTRLGICGKGPTVASFHLDHDGQQ